MVKEVIIVEGRDDTNAVKKSVDAVTIETHGYGITKETWQLIDKAYQGPGIIVFTDPDHAGEQIRRRITEKFPNANQAFLDRTCATKAGDIGIENAAPDAIREALSKAKCSFEESSEAVFAVEDLLVAGLVGQANSAEKRHKLGKILGIGYGNGKTLVQRLNKYGIDIEDFKKALKEL
ncbi:MAG: ribonuclease M5 [Clostridiales bacterium]|nr:ribonuclease M5 [Clostridiales bacterium]